jgi:HAD superfamily hydrolase (TIGR01509 family)
MLRALIFDVDGTLADTEELHRQAFNAAFERHDLPWHWGRRTYGELLRVTGGKERIAHFVALSECTGDEKERIAGLIPDIHATKTRVYAELVAKGRAGLRAGIAELIHEARSAGLRLAIASTTTPENITALIASSLGNEAEAWFDVIAAGDQVFHKKPAPDIYHVALGRLHLPANECLAFEDSANGLAAAKAAGLCTVVAPTRWTADEDLSAADLLLAEFTDARGLGELQAFHSRWCAQTAVAA